jgi:hypothetical protein
MGEKKKLDDQYKTLQVIANKGGVLRKKNGYPPRSKDSELSKAIDENREKRNALE